MKIKVYVVDLEISRERKQLTAKVGFVLALLFGFGSTVDAAPESFSAGEPLSSAKMNANFADIDGHLARIDARLTGGGQYMVGSVYCGATVGSTAGDMSGFGPTEGYLGARAACQKTCKDSPTAHLCTSDEVARSATLGLVNGTGWFATITADCVGFTDATSGAVGYRWQQTNAAQFLCNTTAPLLCCDASPL